MPTQYDLLFNPVYQTIRDDVFAFCRALNFQPTWQQAEVLEAYQAGNRNITVRSGQGSGKTRLETVIAAHWSLKWAPSKVWVTAPTMHQLKGVWVSEFRQMLEHAEPFIKDMFTVRTMDIIVMGDPDWKIECITAADPTAFQGRHHPNGAWIVDEASGMDREIMEVIDGTISHDNYLYAMFGNPNTLHTYFWNTFVDWRENWWTYRINTEESPIVNQENVERLAELYGKESDVYRVRVLGEFPQADPASIIGPDDLDYCIYKTDPVLAARMAPGIKQIGSDFARMGNDSSVHFRRTGNCIREAEVMFKQELDIVVAKSFQMQERAGWANEDTRYVIDADGMGQGLIHIYKNAGKQFFPFHSGSTKNPNPMYHDYISEAWFNLGNLVKAKAIHCPSSIPMLPRLIRELTTRQYHLTRAGELIVENKDEYKNRTGVDQSPDMADGIVMAFYEFPGDRGRVATGQKAALDAHDILQRPRLGSSMDLLR